MNEIIMQQVEIIALLRAQLKCQRILVQIFAAQQAKFTPEALAEIDAAIARTATHPGAEG